MPYIFCYLGLTANLLICYFIFIFCRINNISRQPKKHFVTVLCKSILFVSAKAPAPAYQLLIMARQQPKLEPDLLASTGLQGINPYRYQRSRRSACFCPYGKRLNRQELFLKQWL